jgi:hypothetical protein
MEVMILALCIVEFILARASDKLGQRIKEIEDKIKELESEG